MKGVETELNGLLQEQGHLTEQQKKNKTELAELKKVCMTPNSINVAGAVKFNIPLSLYVASLT